MSQSGLFFFVKNCIFLFSLNFSNHSFLQFVLNNQNGVSRLYSETVEGGNGD